MRLSGVKDQKVICTLKIRGTRISAQGRSSAASDEYRKQNIASASTNANSGVSKIKSQQMPTCAFKSDCSVIQRS